MNYIQQNARDLCAGLREMKWNRLEQEMLSSPVPAWKQHTPPANLHRMRPSDARLDRLFAEDVNYMPKQLREQMLRAAMQCKTPPGEFNV